MTELKQLSSEELKILWSKSIELRDLVNTLVNEYGYTANDLTSRQFEHDIERWYGYRTLSGKTGERP